MLWRHGDVLIGSIDQLPTQAISYNSTILLHGEFTGHSHRIEDSSTATLYEDNDQLNHSVLAEVATIIHEEHKSIILPRGLYRIWQQREYIPGAIRRVAD